ncbi:MAG: permease-like cell division protein FtsX [Gaiellales bacterium]
MRTGVWMLLLVAAALTVAACGDSESETAATERAACIKRLDALKTQVEGGEMSVSIVLADSIGARELATLRTQLKEMDGVGSIEYIDKDEALEQMRKQFEDADADVLDQAPGNPFPATLNVTTASLEATERLTKEITGKPGVDDIASSRLPQLSLQMIESFKAGLPDKGCMAAVEAFAAEFEPGHH